VKSDFFWFFFLTSDKDREKTGFLLSFLSSPVKV